MEIQLLGGARLLDDAGDDIDLVVSAGYGAESIGLNDLAVRIGGQRLSGQGCLLLGGPELNLSLEAETLDLEGFAALSREAQCH